jgi:tellurite resistance protein TerC
MGLEGEKEIHPESNPVVRLFKKFFPVTHETHEDKFFVRIDKRWFATPLFIVVLVVEITDLVFAIDSIPAILAISRDPFIVYTSNAFAILGLRSLFFALAGLLNLLQYLKYGLSVVLMFIGSKMVLAEWVHISTGVSLLVVVSVLGISTIASLLSPARRKKKQADA